MTTQSSGSVRLSGLWDGASPTARLQDWLDPTNSSFICDGYSPGPPSTQVQVRARIMLEGPYDEGDGTMHDALRASGLLPLGEPYLAMGYPHAGGNGETTTDAVLNVTGLTAIVDWVVVELRDANDASTVVSSRSALLRRNGRIVDTDGISDVHFDVPPGLYYVAVGHRNHLGVMTQDPVLLDVTATMLDLTDGTTPLYGAGSATKDINGVRCLYAGDVNHDGLLRYAGAGNDRDPVLVEIGGWLPTATVVGYEFTDVNMDGVVKYTGASNDIGIILVNIGGVDPTVTIQEQMP
jgi:hypothetical protein